MMRLVAMRKWWLGALALTVALAGCGYDKPANPDTATAAGRLPVISPDYAGVVVPPNIAPLNFRVKEAGGGYYVRISSAQGQAIELADKAGRFRIPLAKWKGLLTANQGRTLRIEIFVKDQEGTWTCYDAIENTISRDPVDGYLAFRRMVPWYVTYREMNIYQRHLEDFEERTLLENSTIAGEPGHVCNNCHSFCSNRPDAMTIHARFPFLMAVARNGEVKALDTRTDLNKSPFAYAAWHPNGRFAVYSVNKIIQLFHSTGDTRDVVDYVSDLLLYDFDGNEVTTTPAISRPDMLETFPTWSPDGRYLYFCRTPSMSQSEFATRYSEVKYDLVRIPFDPEKLSWGEVETVLAAADLGGSVGLPRVSPDGRFVLYCLSDYGTFPVFHASSDLYLLNLETKKTERLACNSDKAESWHSWSSNGRWIVFSSKRRDGLFTLPFFSYIDAAGQASKPFVLPQEDPECYEKTPETYSAPEMIAGPVPFSPQTIAGVLYNEKNAGKVKLDPEVLKSREKDKEQTPGRGGQT